MQIITLNISQKSIIKSMIYDEFLDFKTAGEKLFFKLLCGNVNIDEFF